MSAFFRHSIGSRRHLSQNTTHANKVSETNPQKALAELRITLCIDVMIASSCSFELGRTCRVFDLSALLTTVVTCQRLCVLVSTHAHTGRVHSRTHRACPLTHTQGVGTNATGPVLTTPGCSQTVLKLWLRSHRMRQTFRQVNKYCIAAEHSTH